MDKKCNGCKLGFMDGEKWRCRIYKCIKQPEKKIHELVREDCIYEDCKYRGSFAHEPACMYMLYTGKPRGCKISECTRYKKGKGIVTSCFDGFHYDI